MSRYHSYLNSASVIISRYEGKEPLPAFLKKYFAADKKFGSKDRKMISHLCYCYFRAGKLAAGLPVEERIVRALFLCTTEPGGILSFLRPEWEEKLELSLIEKILFLQEENALEKIFPFGDSLSDDLDKEKFILSHFIQPDLFLRLRPGREIKVMERLKEKEIDFRIVEKDCLALPNASKIDQLIELNKEAVVQDLNSQQTGKFIFKSKKELPTRVKAWDCCAGSGGKSIMLYDMWPGIELTVSDIRKSILANLQKRFEEAGITRYKSGIIDLASSSFPMPAEFFDLILADVPCTGSGTWSRSPEQLYFFEKEKIEVFASMQKKIISHTLPSLRPGGLFLYITCSVFKKENEEAVDFIRRSFQLELMGMEILKGYDKKADTLFAALLRKAL